MEAQLFATARERIRRAIAAAATTRYYSRVFAERGIAPNSIGTYEDFCSIPILTKDLYRRNSFDLLTEPLRARVDPEYYHGLGSDFNAKKDYLYQRGLYPRVTSGSTGRPLEVIKSRHDIKRDYYALAYYRQKSRVTMPTGQFIWIWPVSTYVRRHFYTDQTSPAYRVNAYGHQYGLADFSVTAFGELYDFMKTNHTQWITASPSMLAYFARFLTEHGLSLPEIIYVECHSEAVYPWQRELIAATFGCDPTSIYSSNEVQFMGGTCSKGSMHINSGHVFLELVKNGAGGKEVLATPLNNPDVPLLRYSLGDCAEWNIDQQCGCRLEGTPIILLKGHRSNDLIVSRSGVRYDPAVVADAILIASRQCGVGIGEYKARQQEYDQIVYYVEDRVFRDQEVMRHMSLLFHAYFEEVLGYKVKVEICALSSIADDMSMSKYRYFEVAEHLRRNDCGY